MASVTLPAGAGCANVLLLTTAAHACIPGHGAFGTVCIANWNGNVVAVKVMDGRIMDPRTIKKVSGA